MANTFTTDDLIDLMALQYGEAYASTNSEFRTKALNWLQASENEICAMRHWWFLVAEQDFSYLSGTSAHDCPSDVESVIDMYDASANPLEFVPERTYNDLFRADATTGTPAYYTVQWRNSTSRILRVSIWPVPSAATTGTIRYKLFPAVLTDSSGSHSRIPIDKRIVLYYDAICRASLDDERIQVDQSMKARRDEMLAAMIADQETRMNAA